ncbi:PREDICTED: uncharacterized protein LOC106789867 [Polistes canadensis]|uniref:uncharacterized protein LOC106789867 n=1 Tax=Polistes canadensis TaxID=91411 RepID=UPI000718CC9C|nr:PREDICTED: uncharacterized protein LOC106789867 [Polistes canadensis]XP_014610005.1 PREDICTED: uncharacterized protein LOC106789867 [Polistes canadensis]
MEPVSSLKRRSRSIKLRSSDRIYKKWGLKYHAAVRNAVFKLHPIPFVPLKAPDSLKCNNEESDLVYVCQQCKDCFWFKSSFEDHSQRHSWILGFWCQKCFLTVCTHVPNSSTPCDLCVNMEHDKRSYMKKRGIHKHQKMGTIRVFYNQCQFFAHLKLHNISLVNICDIMLMPFPNVEGDWTSKMEFACEALLEYCFMIRVHIMDWLRANKINRNWWKLVENNIDDDDNPITKIIKTYNGRNLFHLDVAKVDAELVPLNSLFKLNFKSSTSGLSKVGSEKNEKDSNKNISDMSIIATANSVSSQNTLEDEDNPCTPTDITFVNCGPTYKCYTYDSLIDYSSHKNKMMNSNYVQYMNKNTQSTITKKQSKQKRLKKETVNYITSVSSSPNRSSNFISAKDSSNQNLEKDFSYMQKDLDHKCSNSGKLSSITITTQNSTDNLIKNAISKNANLLPNLSHEGIMNQEYEKQKHLSTIKNDSNLLTFQGTDSVKMNALITQIPSHLSNNKIVFVGQDMDRVNKTVNHVTLDAKFHEKDIKSVSTKLIPLHIRNSAILEDNKSSGNLQKIADESNKTKSPHQISLEGTIVYRNGRRYILTHTSNDVYQLSTSTSPDSSNNLQVVQHNTNNQNGATKLSLFENTYLNLPETNVSLPTPSPSSSELSNSSSCEIQKKQNSAVCVQKESEISRHYLKPKFKQSILDLMNNDGFCEALSFRRAENAEIYLNIKKSKSSAKQLNVVTTVTIPNCRQDMLNEFRQLNYPELMERIRHLQNVRKEILSVMNFAEDKAIEDTLKSIRNLQTALEDALESCKNESEDMKDLWNDEEILSNDWESKCQYVNNFRCSTCSKVMKPKTYIPGFSKPAENDIVYCSCYKHFCQECRSYQGNVTRFLTHQNFHEEEKPYACPDCFRRFPSFRSLEGHTWSFCFHMLKKRVFCCKICQIVGFQDTESIARHFAVMHSSKKIACETCNMVLDTYNEYKRHRDKMHSTMIKSEPIRLMICKLGQCINRCEKYMMHLEKHYGVRKIIWLKCPFCPYYNLESKQFLMQFKIHFQIVHLYRLLEIIKPEILKDILPSSLYECLFKENESLSCERFRKLRNCNENVCSDTMVPKIINTQTIASEDFEQVLDNNEGSGSIQSTIKNDMEDDVWPIISNKMSNFNISDAKLENTDCSIVYLNTDKKDNLPKILDVRSMANVLSKDQKCSSDIDNMGKISVESKEIQSNDKTQKPKSIVNDQSKETCNSAKENIKSDAKCITNHSIISENKEVNGVDNVVIKLNESSLKTSEILIPIDSKLNVLEKINSTLSALIETSNEIKISDDVNSMSVIESEPITTLSTSNDPDNEMNEDINIIPKPPPLIRIPQYFLESRNQQEDKIKKSSRTISHTSGNRKTNVKRPWRIALNGPTNSKDVYQDYVCHLCGELINTAWPIISIHFNTRHLEECKLSVVTPRLLRITPEFINGGYKELFSNKKRKSEGTIPISKKKRRWSAKKHTDSNNSFGLGLYVEQESIEDEEGNFICRKCNQRCANMSDLREHIASNHRIKGRYLVCLECGENFVVAPSLQMHLKAFHGIEDPISYMNQNSSYAPDNIDDLDNETKAMIANQCSVCMAVFEDKASVDKHLRVHGMAFLNRKRIEAQNALKSPEKNVKINDEKKSFQKENTKEPIKRDNPSNTILEKINATIVEAAQ